MLLGILAGISAFSTLGFIVFFRASLTFQRRVHQLQRELELANDKSGEFFQKMASARGDVERLKKENKTISDNHVLRVEEIKRLKEEVVAYRRFINDFCEDYKKLRESIKAYDAPQEETPHKHPSEALRTGVC